jgi:putative pyruvate formate lyase activating enzyme
MRSAVVDHLNLAERAVAAAHHLDDCQLCPHRCGTRRASATGVCRVGQSAYIASEMLHMGEEAVLRPTHAIFFSGCTATCSFCTAARFAFRPTYGVTVPAEALAQRILQRQEEGARSVAFIGGDPTPHIPFVVAVRAALGDALRIPLVFNSNYYLTPEALALLDGIVDIHLPDLKFGLGEPGRDCGTEIGGMPGYWEVVTAAIDAAIASGKQVIVRHLLMPGHFVCCTTPVLEWLGTRVGVEVSLLTQYLAPAHARGELAGIVSRADVEAAFALARRLGLRLVE